MRIVQLAQRPQRRGAEIFAAQLAAVLGDMGHELHTIHLYRPPDDGGSPLPPAGATTGLDGDPAHPAERFPTIQPGLLAELRRTLRGLDPEVVQANGARTVKYGSVARRLAGAAGWALVYRNIGNPVDWVRGPLRRAYYRHLVAPPIDGVAVLSRATLGGVERVYAPPPTTPVVHLPHAVDLSALEPTRDRTEVRRALETPAEAPVVVFVGRLSREKRPDRLLRVFADLRRRRPTLVLWVIGGGPLEEETRRAAEETGVADAVRLTGEQQHVADLLSAADLLLLTSDTEGVPGVILEAGACGLPAVAPAVGGVAECVVDGVTGRLAPAGDEAALAAAAAELLDDDGLRQRAGRAARDHVRRHHDLRAVAGGYLDLYARAVERRRER